MVAGKDMVMENKNQKERLSPNEEIQNWKQFDLDVLLRKITGKDIVIAFLTVVMSYCIVFECG